MSDLDKPSRNEDEYFARQELERKKQWAKENAAKMAAAEREKLKQQHFMKCPKCGSDLHTVELHGVSIDTCATCHGTWLDAGELEQMLQPGKKDLFHRVMSVFK
ncbi:MAG: zf-TFIIB domain-containing protein [Acidobacteriota bacterium]